MDTSIEHTLAVLDTEKMNPATTEIDRMSTLEIVEVINAEDVKVAQAVKQVLPQIARAIEEIATRLRGGGRLVYVGAGTSGRLGALDASECPPTFNIPPEMVITGIAGGPQALGQAYEDLEDSWEAGQADACKMLLQTTCESDIFILATVNAHLDEQQAELVRCLISSGRHIIVIAVRNPYDLRAFPQLRTYLCTYEYSRPALVAAVRVVFGERQALGHLPVNIPSL